MSKEKKILKYTVEYQNVMSCQAVRILFENWGLYDLIQLISKDFILNIICGSVLAQTLSFLFCFAFCLFFRDPPKAYGDSQARGLIRATAAGLCQGHSNMGSKPCLPPTPQLTATPVP